MSTGHQNRVLQFQVKQFIPKMINNDTLEMLTTREQMIEDIYNIVDSHYPDPKTNDVMIEELCDAVCRNFPTK